MSLSTLRRLTFGVVGTGLCWLAVPASADEVPAKATTTPAVATPDSTTAKVTITDSLAREAEQAIQVSGRRFLDVDVQTPWQIVHGLLAYRQQYVLKQQGKKINALEWIASGPNFHGQPWWEKTYYGGHAHPYNGNPYEFQGHPNQFLAYMTMCNLPLSYKFRAGTGEMLTISDLIRGAQMEVNDREEVTWTLWFLTHYLEPDAQWTSQAGEAWSIERLVQVETGKTVTAAACGGTHGLFALAYARNSHLSTGRPLYGAWLEADQKVRRYVAEARSNQNSDGSFSSNFFQGPGYSQDFVKRLSSTGHILEFLCVALPHNRLSEEWIRRAVASVARDLYENRNASAECGALYHAVDSLMIYRSQIWPELDPSRNVVTAAKPVTPASSSTPAPSTPPTTDKSAAPPQNPPTPRSSVNTPASTGSAGAGGSR